jgi:hypothetical protein
MASAAERTFIAAVATAESTRQVAKAAAFATWAFQQGAPLTTYIAALLAADVAYITAVNTALNTSALPLGNLGQSGPIPTVSASLST